MIPWLTTLALMLEHAAEWSATKWFHRRTKPGQSTQASAVGSLTGRRSAVQSGSGTPRQWYACALVLVVCVPLTMHQTRMYRDLETLWRITLERNPEAWMAHHNLAILLESGDRRSEALTHYTAAYTLNPRHVFALNNAALLHIENGQFTTAENLLRQALAVNPGFALGRNSIAIALVRQNRLQEAVEQLDAALEVVPDYSTARSNRDAILKAMNESRQDADRSSSGSEERP
jgi:tetratricopeptide (TPR) repeat protein